jgi:hypothetical protein
MDNLQVAQLELSQIESSQKQHNEDIKQQMAIELLETEQQYKRFSLLKPKIYLDGNKWCVLYGKNIQDGVAGFGDTAHEAVLDWEQNWNIKPKH